MRVDWTNTTDPNYGRRAVVTDLVTGGPVGLCQVADEETGEYSVLLQEDGSPAFQCGEIVLTEDKQDVRREVRKGQIKIEFLE